MKKNESDIPPRRKFLTMGLLGSAVLLTQKVNAMVPDTDNDDTVKMLTKDGKLVEVSRKVLDKTEDRTKVNNEGILNWTDHNKKSTP